MRIPFHKPHIDQREINAVIEVLKSKWLTTGEITFRFEQEFSKYVEAKESVFLTSGTAGLHLSLKAIGVKEGDEIIIPTFTFVATCEVVEYLKATPILIDVRKEDHLINIEQIEKNITKKTKAIIPVHYGGQPADLKPLIEISEKYGIGIIEDAAHAIPSWYQNQKIGSFNTLTVFSFYATKPLSTGEGGMLTTQDQALAKRLRSLRLHGITKDAWKRYKDTKFWYYDVEEIGFKYNPTDIQAALGIEQLKKQDFLWEKRKKIAKIYDEAFKDIEKYLYPYILHKDRESSYHLYTIKLNLDALKINRDIFMKLLYERGIHTSVHFIPIHRLKAYKKYGKNRDLKNSDWIYERIVSLPIYPDLTQKEVEYIIENVIDIIKKNSK